jgi:tetratricopeptide (TPR) repeat protein
MLRSLKAVLTFAVVLLSVNAAAWANDFDDCGTNADIAVGSRFNAVIAACSRLIAKNNNTAFAFAQRAWLYEKQGDLDRAIGDFKEAARLGPDQSTPLYQLALCTAYRNKGDADLGIEACSQLISRKQNTSSSQLGEAYRIRAELYLKKGDRDNAVPDLVEAFKLAPTWSRDAVRARLISIVGEEKSLVIIGASATIVPLNSISDVPTLPTTEAHAQPILPRNETKAVLPDNKIAAVPPSSKLQLIQPLARASEALRVALVIGNSAYQNVPFLPNPVNDATDLSASLRRLGFDVKTLSNARYDDMRRALIDFGPQARGAEIALIFFAGHGIQIGGENWLIPVDAQLTTDLNVANEAIGLQSLTRAVSNTTKLGLVILDACRNDPFRPKMQSTNLSRAVERGFSRVEPSDNDLVAYAARDGTTAGDGSGRNSPFTASLLKNIETPGLEIRFLFANVRDDVMVATMREQQPFVYGSLSRDMIYLKTPLEAVVPIPGGSRSR